MADRAKDPREVAVIYGRNDDARAAIFDFLRALDLKPLEFSQAIHRTGEAAPYIGSILSALFSSVQAVVVILTGDEMVQLQEQFRDPKNQEDSQISFQSRPNVLFEAGLAMASHPNRTVLVQMGEHRAFSDIGGRHVLRFGGETGERNNLASRLKEAGCPVDTTGTDWLTAGDFAKALNIAATNTDRRIWANSGQDTRGAPIEVPSAPEDECRERILLFIADQQDQGTSLSEDAQIAESLGIEIRDVRRHLDILASRGLLKPANAMGRWGGSLSPDGSLEVERLRRRERNA